MATASAPKLGPDFIERAAELFMAKIGMTRDRFNELDAEMKSRAFTVSYVESLDKVKAIQDLLGKAVQEGTTLGKFRKVVADYLESTDWHMETVFRTNIQSAYGAARWEAAQRLRSLRPYGRYSAVMDGRTRPTHAELHGLVYPLDHPFWRWYWPPWDYNCRCHVRTLTQWDLDQAGLDPEVALPNVRLPKDFVSPARAGVEIDPEQLLLKRKLDADAHAKAHAKLSEELAYIERQRLPVTGVGPVGEYAPGMLPSPYVPPVPHEIEPLPSWKPEMKAADVKKLFADSKVKDALYVSSGDHAKVREWRKSGFTADNAISKAPYFGEGAYFSSAEPSGPSIKVAVNVRNPYVFEWDGVKTNALTSHRGPLGDLLRAELDADPSLSRERAVTRILRRLGHDGVVVTNSNTGEKIVVVFDREQAAMIKAVAKKAPKALTDTEYLVQLTKAQEAALEYMRRCGDIPSATELEKELAGKIQQDLEAGNIKVSMARRLRRDSASYKDVYKNGVFKNQFELRERATSSGALCPKKGGSRDGWENSLYGGRLHEAPEYAAIPDSGYLPAGLAQERPIYGYLHTEESFRRGYASSYGNIVFHLDPAVLERTSYTIGDSSGVQGKSFKGAMKGGHLLPISRATIRESGTSLAQEYVRGSISADAINVNGNVGYIECQVLGGIDLRRGDVRSITVYTRALETPADYEHIRKLGEKYNIPVNFIDGQSFLF